MQCRQAAAPWKSQHRSRAAARVYKQEPVTTAFSSKPEGELLGKKTNTFESSYLRFPPRAYLVYKGIMQLDMCTFYKEMHLK